MAEFSERLRLLREKKGISQQELADFLGVNKQTISGYERGVRRPAGESARELYEKLADYFNVDTSYLMGLSDYSTSINKPFDYDFSQSFLEKALSEADPKSPIVKELKKLLKDRDILLKKDTAILRTPIKELESIQKELMVYGFSPRIQRYNKMMQNPFIQQLLDAAYGCTDDQVQIATNVLNSYKPRDQRPTIENLKKTT